MSHEIFIMVYGDFSDIKSSNRNQMDDFEFFSKKSHKSIILIAQNQTRKFDKFEILCKMFFTKRLRALDTGYRVDGGGEVTQIIKSPLQCRYGQ